MPYTLLKLHGVGMSSSKSGPLDGGSQGWSAVHKVVRRFLESLTCPSDLMCSAFGFKSSGPAGIWLANGAHLLSVLVLFELSKLISGGSLNFRSQSFALITACLHIVTPAGIFLVAPYAESCFCTLNFLGVYFYVQSKLQSGSAHGATAYTYLILCGIAFGIATMFRGNGILSGLILVYEAAELALRGVYKNQVWRFLPRICAVILSGLIMGCLASFPQYLAFNQYCKPRLSRPWCSNLPPSIFAWVQREYWSVGPSVTCFDELIAHHIVGTLAF